MRSGRVQGSLEAPPVETYVGCVCEGRDGRVDEVPRTVLAVLALLCHTHAEIGDLLDHLGKFLSRAWLRSNQLPRARFERCCVTHKHDVAAVLTHRLEDEPCDVVHAFVKLQVRLVRFEIVQCHLRQVGGVNLEPLIHKFPGAHEGGESPTTPGKPLKEAVLDANLRSLFPETLQYGVRGLHAAESRGGEDVRDSNPLLSDTLPRQPSLKQSHFRHRCVFEELVGPALPVRDLLRHVEVASVVVAVGVKGQLDPLFPKRHVHSLCVSEQEQTTRTCTRNKQSTTSAVNMHVLRTGVCV